MIAPGGHRLCSRLGGGGQADIFLALAPGLLGSPRPLVLKRLHPGSLGQPELVTAFFDEARVSARLCHPNIVHTYGAGEGDGYFIAMEYLEGQPLNRLRAHPRAGSLPPATWARVVADALAGLHHAHELADFDGTPLGLVHRDVSPHNVFVTYEGQVKLLDFGVAKASLNNARTEVGAIKGKASYMAPEQIRGESDRRSDIFAMGVVLWEALAGRKPVEGDMFVVMKQVLDEPMPRLSSALPDVDPELDAIVARALESDPDDRYPTARAMREALETYLTNVGEPSGPENLGRWLRDTFAAEREQARTKLRAALQDAPPEPEAKRHALPFIGPARAPSLPPPAPWPRSWYALSQALIGVAAFAITGSAIVAATTLSNPSPPAPPVAAKAIGAAAPPALPAASLDVISDPAGAQIFLGDDPLGTTPLTLVLSPGTYTLRLSKEGYRPEFVTIDLPEPGVSTSRAISLRPLASAPSTRPIRARLRPGERHPG